MSVIFSAFKCDGYYSIYQCTSEKEKVTIPDFFDGLPVKQILAEAFKGKKKIKEISLPNHLEGIFVSAFEDCENLEKINIPDTVVEISAGAFRNCKSLKKVKLPSNLNQISIGVFDGCEQLKSITLPENVQSLGSNAFANCKNLTKVELNEHLRFMGYNTFSNCSSLTEIIFQRKLILISDRSFYNCQSLKKVIAFNTSLEIDNDVFLECDNIEEFNLTVLKAFPFKLQCKLLSESFYNKDLPATELKQMITYLKRKKTLKKYFFTSDNAAGISYLLDSHIKLPLDELELYIKENIKQNNTAVIAILLDYKEKNFSKEEILAYEEQIELVEIGFENPTNKQLKEKWRCGKIEDGFRISSYKGSETIETIPLQTAEGVVITQVTSVKGNKSNFEPIETLNIVANITEIGEKTFRWCETLKSVNFPETLTKIGNQSFIGCKKLEEIQLPECMQTIDFGAFAYCEGLTELYIPKTVKNINAFAFAECLNLKNVTVSKKTKINKSAFENSPLVNLIKY